MTVIEHVPSELVQAGSWDDVLDQLEAALDVAERVADWPVDAVPLDAWTAPVALGPMPARCEARARALHERQLSVAAELARARDRTARQLSALAHVRSNADRTAAPAYLDRAL